MRPKRCRVTLEELLDLEEGRAEPPLAQRLRAHLAAGCDACEAQRAEIVRTLSVMREGELESAPKRVVQAVRDLFRERFVKPLRKPLFARLVFDSRSQLAMAGTRGAETGQIQALYTTDEHDVDLWQERGTDGGWHLIGQVLPKDGGSPLAPDEAALTSGAVAVMATLEGAELHFSGLSAGEYTLRIGLPDAEIAVEVAVGA